LARTLGSHLQCERIAVGLEAHGREHIFDDVDLTRTVGWFTTYFPIVLEAAGSHASVLQATRDVRARVPNKGLSYGVLRELGLDARVRAQLATLEPEIFFNYLGQLQRGGEQGVLAIRDGAGRAVSLSTPNLPPLSIDA